MRQIIIPLIASVAMNTLMIVSVDRAFLVEGKRLEFLKKQKVLQASRDPLPFDFIESPVFAKPQKPVRSRKISNQDSVSRDQSKNKSKAPGSPKIDTVGPAEQLAQAQARPANHPSIASKPQQEMKKQEAPPIAEPPKSDAATPAEEGIAKKEEPRLPSPAIREQAANQNLVNQEKKPALNAESGKKDLSGQSKILTQAMTRSKSKGASLNGVTSYDAMGSDMGVYMKNVKEKIWLAWFPYITFQYPNDFRAADAVIRFTLNAKGELKNMRVLDSYGSRVFTTFCLDSVQRASGFGPVPKEILALLGKDELEIWFTFHYR